LRECQRKKPRNVPTTELLLSVTFLGSCWQRHLPDLSGNQKASDSEKFLLFTVTSRQHDEEGNRICLQTAVVTRSDSATRSISEQLRLLLLSVFALAFSLVVCNPRRLLGFS